MPTIDIALLHHPCAVPAEMAAAIVGPQGPPGEPGPPGPAGDAGGALLVTNCLSELASDPAAQAQALANLGIATVDGGTFF